MATVAIAERPAEQQQPGERERVGVDDPLQAAGARVQLPVEGGQRDVDDGRVQHGDQQAEAENGSVHQRRELGS